VPTSVITGKRMKFVDNHDSDVLEELSMIDLRRHQDRFKGFRCREKAVGRIDHGPALVPLTRVAVPAGCPPTNQLEVPLESLLLVVQKRPNGADVKYGQTGPALGQHLRDDREKCCLGLPACGRGEDHHVRSVQARIYRQTLHGSQFPPAEGI
jgi:hypothetical protein